MAFLSLLLLLGGMAIQVSAQGPKVVVVEIQHFSGEQFGPFIPMMELGLEGGSQKVLAQLDTGSADLVLAKKGSDICRKQEKDCQDIPEGAGSFLPSNNSSTKVLKEPFNASFVSGESFTGTFAKTGIQIGDAMVEGAQFGLYDEANQPDDLPLFPICGTGFVGAESTDNKYPNLPAQMVATNKTNTNTTSCYINDFRGPSGSCVFGGIDEAKFHGELQELKWLPFPGEDEITDPVVEFSSVRFIPGSGTGNKKGGAGNQTREFERRLREKEGPDSQKGRSRTGDEKKAGDQDQGSQKMVDLSGGKKLPPALIDSGASVLLLPLDTMKSLAKEVGASLDDDLNDDGLSVDYGIVNSGAMLQVGFGKDRVLIQVPLDMMVQPADLTGEDKCTLALFVAEGEDGVIATLGSVLLQAAYTAFDNDQKRLLMAPAKLNVTESSIKELPPPPSKGQDSRDGPRKRDSDSANASRRRRARLQRRGERSRKCLDALRRKGERRRSGGRP